MLAAYGGECSNCGISDPEVLDIDHIDNTGCEDRQNGLWGWKLYRQLRNAGYPTENYQLLCRNCNWKKHLANRREVAMEIMRAIKESSAPTTNQIREERV